MISERTLRNGQIKELVIFDHFCVDNNLPKYKKDKETLSNNNIVGGSWGVDVPISGNMVSSDSSYNISRKERIKRWLISKIEGKKKTPIKTKVITIGEFFTNLSKSFKELSPIGEISDYYEKALNQATTMGQTVLIEKLKDNIEMVRGEAHLIAMGLKKYVTEKQVIDFYDKVGDDKNLKLTWIKNFSRIIPEDVYKVKKDTDEREIFDNYVILHYDPQDNGSGLTKEELEKKKDPILFGLIKNSRKLYYVADWKDDYCDLTLEEMFNTLGEKVLEINNKHVKTFIDKI